MFYKVSNTDKVNVRMDININEEYGEIGIEISYYDKNNDIYKKYEYPANCFKKALADYKKLEKGESL